MIRDTITPDVIMPQTGLLPEVLLPYQQKLLGTTSKSPVTLCEKSRRIGMTWGVGADAVLVSASNRASGGMDSLYIGYNLDMTREFIDTCAGWAKAFDQAASAVEEILFDDGDADDTKSIKAFRIRFASGFEITALSSRPRSLRGRQGYVIIDEAAFHDDLKELLKAALALLIWGGKVLLISTHNGVDNPFNQLVQDVRAKKLNYAIIKVDLDDALRDGLYRRICLVQNKEWSPAGEAQWRDEVIGFYGDAAEEELFCVPRKSAGAYLSSVLVESRMEDVPVVTWSCDDTFVFLPEEDRRKHAEDFCATSLRPLLEQLDPNLASYLGGDFGRSGDLSVQWPIQVAKNLNRLTPFTLELQNVPFTQQRQIMWYIIDRLPRFGAAALDARGNGQQLAEETMQRYGINRVHQVMTGPAFYLDAFPPYKAALQDGTFVLPRNADILEDHRAVVVVNGVPQIPNSRKKGADGGKRHGDSAVAAVLSHWASRQQIVEYGYQPLGRRSGSDQSVSTDEDYHSTGRFGRAGSW